ncbi:tRNA lysidine(34) synthetase TilS [Anaeromyxobacter oryzae]|uniref:tRNA(Ile)-lysidine synthase n=1 Tax=Anaeromyxobacter oryzae TaxID=2918170 RepID=A0ABM7X3I4_9BACT|nr:tRNA lysidine(34) synthetase TilS [Anaeromyxobacter oryzae]BDG06344.1 tRNA(Ile)-lysidine synthase [Anaeromyxobacter oryzae]
MRKKRLHPYEARVLATLRRRRLLGPEDHALVALSAGPDSTALVAALAALRDTGHLRAVSALHVDHGLRPEVDADAAAAAEACERLGVAFASVRVVVGAGNVQAAARRARYAALRAEATRVGATRIATGHTRSDQAETVLFRLLRGAGARGLGGIPPRRGIVVRPLIDRAREEGLAYLDARRLRWRDDPTNASPRFTRNRIRHEVLPALRAVAPAAERSLARAADLARSDDRALEARARVRAGDETGITVAALASQPDAVRRRIVRRLWRNAGGGRALGRERVDAVLALLRRGRPGRATLRGGLEARCRYGRLEIVRGAPPDADVAEIEVPGPGRYAVPERGIAVEVVAARADAVSWPLALRTRRPGDRFRPDGGCGAKKLKGWLIDRKVPREARDGLLLLARGRDVVAIADLGAVAEGLGPAGAGLVVRVGAAL